MAAADGDERRRGAATVGAVADGAGRVRVSGAPAAARQGDLGAAAWGPSALESAMLLAAVEAEGMGGAWVFWPATGRLAVSAGFEALVFGPAGATPSIALSGAMVRERAEKLGREDAQPRGQEADQDRSHERSRLGGREGVRSDLQESAWESGQDSARESGQEAARERARAPIAAPGAARGTAAAGFAGQGRQPAALASRDPAVCLARIAVIDRTRALLHLRRALRGRGGCDLELALRAPEARRLRLTAERTAADGGFALVGAVRDITDRAKLLADVRATAASAVHAALLGRALGPIPETASPAPTSPPRARRSSEDRALADRLLAEHTPLDERLLDHALLDHAVQEPLRKVVLYADLAKRRYSEIVGTDAGALDAELAGYLDAAERGAQALARLVAVRAAQAGAERGDG